MFSTRKCLRRLALAAFGFLLIPSGCAHAQTIPRGAHVVRTQFVKAAGTVDPSTLTGKLIMGYQGWFNCPGDGTTVGWWHWFSGPDPDYGLSAECSRLPDR
jgi:hypothetical protein